MNLPASNFSEDQSWNESSAPSKYQVIPCLVLGLGDVVVARFDTLRHSTEFWLGDAFPANAVNWGTVTSSQHLPATWAEQHLERLLSLELWQYLSEHEYVDRQLQPGALVPIHVYLLYDPGESPGQFDGSLIKGIAEQLRHSSRRRAKLTISLIVPWLGDNANPAPTSEVEQATGGVDVIYIMQRVDQYGRGVDPTLRYDTLRLLLHTLITSSAGAVIDGWVDTMPSYYQRPPVLGVGTAAISTAIGQMRAYRAARLSQLLLADHVGELPTDEQIRVELLGKKSADRAAVSWELPALEVFGALDWLPKDNANALRTITPAPTSALSQALRDCSPAMADLLAQELIALDHRIRVSFALEAEKRLNWLLEEANDRFSEETDPLTVAFSVHLSESPLTNSGAIEAVDTLSSGDRWSEYVPSAHEITQPRLSRVSAWLGALISSNPVRFGLSKDLSISPIYSSDEEGWKQQAKLIFAKALARKQNYARLQQKTSTIGQLLLRAFLLLLLVILLTQSFADNIRWMVWLGSLFAILAVTLFSFLSSRRRLKLQAEALYAERLSEVRHLVLSMASFHANAANNSIFNSLSALEEEISKLRSELEVRLQNASMRVKTTIARAIGGNNASLLEYFLYDLSTCDKWVAELLSERYNQSTNTPPQKQITTSKNSVKDMVSTIILETIHGHSLSMNSAQLIGYITNSLGGQDLWGPHFSAIELCDYEPSTVNEGNRWKWLTTHATPLAGAGLNPPELTIIAVSNAADLVGGFGRGNPEWRFDWREARSRQPHRISCTRLLALPSGYLTGQITEVEKLTK